MTLKTFIFYACMHIFTHARVRVRVRVRVYASMGITVYIHSVSPISLFLCIIIRGN